MSDLVWQEGLDGVYSISFAGGAQISVVDWPEDLYSVALIYSKENEMGLSDVLGRKEFNGEDSLDRAKEWVLSYREWEINHEEFQYPMDK